MDGWIDREGEGESGNPPPHFDPKTGEPDCVAPSLAMANNMCSCRSIPVAVASGILL